MSAYRVNFDYDQGFTDVSNWPVTFGFGSADRAEIFGAWTLVRRIDRDVRPIFVPSQPRAGGLVNDYPFVRQGWSDNQLGDLWLGGKVNLTVAVAAAAGGVRAARHGQAADRRRTTTRASARARRTSRSTRIVSKEINQRVELSGYGGVHLCAATRTGVDLTNGFRWGFGAGFPSRKGLRLTAELHGERYLERHADAARRPLIGDGRQHLAARDRV